MKKRLRKKKWKKAFQKTYSYLHWTKHKESILSNIIKNDQEMSQRLVNFSKQGAIFPRVDYIDRTPNVNINEEPIISPYIQKVIKEILINSKFHGMEGELK